MNDFLHIHLPCGDEDIKAIEKALGVKFIPVVPEMIAADKVELHPLSPPSDKPIFYE